MLPKLPDGTALTTPLEDSRHSHYPGASSRVQVPPVRQHPHTIPPVGMGDKFEDRLHDSSLLNTWYELLVSRKRPEQAPAQSVNERVSSVRSTQRRPSRSHDSTILMRMHFLPYLLP